MSDFSYHDLDRALGGKAKADVLCPACGPGRKLPFNRKRAVLRLWAPRAGFISWCCARCGITGGVGEGTTPPRIDTTNAAPKRPLIDRAEPDDAVLDTMHYAQGLFARGLPLKDTPGEVYLNSRAISLELQGNLHHCLRFSPTLMLDGRRVCGIVALFRDILTDAPLGIHRTFLDTAGRKLNRRMLGPCAGAAIKIDPDDSVVMGLVVGEGIESCLSGRQYHRQPLRPVWALGSAGAIGGFPVISHLDGITVLGERESDGAPDKANIDAVMALGTRYAAAGIELILADPVRGGDMNDVLKRVATQ